MSVSIYTPVYVTSTIKSRWHFTLYQYLVILLCSSILLIILHNDRCFNFTRGNLMDVEGDRIELEMFGSVPALLSSRRSDLDISLVGPNIDSISVLRSRCIQTTLPTLTYITNRQWGRILSKRRMGQYEFVRHGNVILYQSYAIFHTEHAFTYNYLYSLYE